MACNSRVVRAAGVTLLIASQTGCAGTTYSRDVPSGVAPPSTELRAAYCGEVWRQETQRHESAQRTGSWLLAAGVGASVASGSTFLAATQTDRDKTDKTLITVGSSLLLAGLAGVITGSVILATNNHEKKAWRAASLATEIVAKGERSLPKESGSSRDEVLDKRDWETRPLFQECLRIQPRTLIATPFHADNASADDEEDAADGNAAKSEGKENAAAAAKPTAPTAPATPTAPAAPAAPTPAAPAAPAAPTPAAPTSAAPAKPAGAATTPQATTSAVTPSPPAPPSEKKK